MASAGTLRYRLGTQTVTRVGFGAMQLPGPGVFGPPADRDAAIAAEVRRGTFDIVVDGNRAGSVELLSFIVPSLAISLRRD